MAIHSIKRGLDLPIAGLPRQEISDARRPSRVAVVATDFHGMKPTMFVEVGEEVKRGQVLFEDKKTPGVVFTAPGAGVVEAINRGERRALLSVVIALSEADQGHADDGQQVAFEAYEGKDPDVLDRSDIEALLVESGLWTALRTRPFNKTPELGSAPHAVFVTAMDTNPLAPSLDVIAEGREAELNTGLSLLGKLTSGRVYFCKGPDSRLKPGQMTRASVEVFEGPHPAGLPGTHIHFLDPVSEKKTVWHVGLQDVIAIGHLFRTGNLDVRRVVSFAGPVVKNPRLLRTRQGAYLDELVEGELPEGEMRVISGSVLSGRKAQGDILGYLSRFDQQISVLKEDREREFIGWLAPGANKFSVISFFASKFNPGKRFNFTTTTNGSHRAMVPVGSYEKVMPLDIMPTHLLRAIIMHDREWAEKLGIIELAEEDVALCTYVCPGKTDYAPLLRETLNLIEYDS